MLFKAVENTDDAVFITDETGRIEYVNPAFERITQYSRQETIGNTPRMLKSGRHSRERYRELWKTILDGKVYRKTVTNRRKNGTIYYSDQTITPVRDNADRIVNFVSVAKDMTDFMTLETQDLSMAVAAEVQQRLYPKTSPVVEGLDIAGAIFPADKTGGDYYDFIDMPDGGIAIAVGDASGHGIGAAMVMMEARALLRFMIAAGMPLDEVFFRINQILHDDLDTGSFITLILASIRPDNGSLTYVSAGHDTCFVVDGSGALKYEMTSTGPPLGMMTGSVFRVCTGPALEEGDVSVFLTDGLMECQAHVGRFLEKKDCLEVIRRHRSETSSKIVESLHALARDFGGDGPLLDDIAIVVCKSVRAGTRAEPDSVGQPSQP